MSKIIYDENNKINESKLTLEQIQAMLSVHKAIIIDVYKKILKHNKSSLIQIRHDYWCKNHL